MVSISFFKKFFSLIYFLIEDFAKENVKYLELRTTPRAKEISGLVIQLKKFDKILFENIQNIFLFFS